MGELRALGLLAATLAALSLSVATAEARNTPCSGKKGGVSHCRGDKFVCNDKSTSASKKKCNQ